MASLVSAFTEALRQRGVEPDTASLAAETGIAVFRVAFERWVAGPEDADLAEVMRATLADLSDSPPDVLGGWSCPAPGG
jgi:hypothetical protein